MSVRPSISRLLAITLLLAAFAVPSFAQIDKASVEALALDASNAPLPVADRDFQRLAFIAPGVQRERGSFRFINGGPVIGAGGNASQSTILVNGVDMTDQVNGLSRARFSQDAIREFRVITNRFDTEI